MATHASIIAWRIPRTEEPGGLQSMGLLRAGQDQAANTFTLWDNGKTHYLYFFLFSLQTQLGFCPLSCPCQGHQRPPCCKSVGSFQTHILLIHLPALTTAPLWNHFFFWPECGLATPSAFFSPPDSFVGLRMWEESFVGQALSVLCSLPGDLTQLSALSPVSWWCPCGSPALTLARQAHREPLTSPMQLSTPTPPHTPALLPLSQQIALPSTELLKKECRGDSPGDPVAKTLSFQCKGAWV